MLQHSSVVNYSAFLPVPLFPISPTGNTLKFIPWSPEKCMRKKNQTNQTKQQFFPIFAISTERSKVMERTLSGLCCGCFAKNCYTFCHTPLTVELFEKCFFEYYDIPLHSYIVRTSSTNQLFIVTCPTTSLTCIITVLPGITVSTLSYVV